MRRLRAPLPTQRIAHLDLSAAPPLVPSSNGHAEVLVFLWWRDLLLGHLTFDAGLQGTSIPPVALHEATAPALEHHLGRPVPAEFSTASARLDARCYQPKRATVPMSVVVPTCRRPAQLAACLQALARCTPLPAETVVVDNAPDVPGAAATAARFGVRYRAEPTPGSAAARNAGLEAARYDRVAFVDDDEVVHPAWAGRLYDALDDPSVVVATGLVLPAALDTPAQVRFERRYGFMRGYAPRRFDATYFAQQYRRGVPTWHVGGSGNMAVNRSAFMAMGGFDVRLGAGSSGGGEDLESFYRVLAGGGVCRYEPLAIAHHHHRVDDDALRQQLHAYMRGHVAAFLFQYARHRHAGNLFHLFLRLPRAFAGYARQSLRGDPIHPPGLLWGEVTGYAAGVRYFFQHRHRPAA